VACLAALGVAGSVWCLGRRTTVDTDGGWRRSRHCPGPRSPRPWPSSVPTRSAGRRLEDRVREALPRGRVRGRADRRPTARQAARAVDAVVRSDGFERFWVAANRQHPAGAGHPARRQHVVAAQGDRVDIDLLPLITCAAPGERRAASLRAPAVTAGPRQRAIPANLRSTVESATGVTLPANFAQFTVYDAGRCARCSSGWYGRRGWAAAGRYGRAAGRRVRGLAVAAAYRAAVGAVAGRLGGRGDRRPARGTRSAARPDPGRDLPGRCRAALRIVTSGLRQRGTQLIWCGVLVAVLAYLSGRAGSRSGCAAGYGTACGRLAARRTGDVALAIAARLCRPPPRRSAGRRRAGRRVLA